ncbi:MAG: TRAP transporter substrate-binding protein DctP [Alcanivoracaceae bacterium]|nr:TRAP transporter substrate-binding protein DctP [Alcanivoracaceae bacterium]
MLRVLVSFLFCLPLLAQAQTLKISTLYPEGTSVVTQLKEAGDAIQAGTEGRVKIKVYPGGVMGDDGAVMRKISIGQLHGAMSQAGAFARQYKDSQVLNLPLAFNSYEEVDYVRKTLDPIIQQGFEDAGWVTFGAADGGFAYVMSTDPVSNLEELRQQKLWLPANDTGSAKAAKVFELSPIMLNIGTVLTSLQTGAINAFAAPPVAALTLQWHSRVKYITDVPLLYTYGILAISKKHFSKMTPADQQVVRDILEKTFAQMDTESRTANLKAYEAIQQQGLKLVTPSAADIKVWKDYAQQATDELVEEGEVSAAMLERLQSLLNEYRAANP